MACVLVLAFEAGFVWHYRYRFWDANYILLEKKQEKLETGPADDVAVFGNSRFYHVQPEVVARALGVKRVTNYAWGYCGVETYEGMLRGLLLANRAPRAIVVDAIPEIFGYPEQLLTSRLNDAFGIGFSVTVPPLAALETEARLRDRHVFWQVLSQYLTPPSVRYRMRLIPGLKSLVNRGALPPLPPEYGAIVSAWEEQGWFYFGDPGHASEEAEFEALEKATGPYKLRKNSRISRRYERFVRLANEHGIQVIMLPLPNNGLVFDKFRQFGIYARYDKWLNDLERRYANFHAPKPRWLCWPGLLTDGLHVNAVGAHKHMELVSDILSSVKPHLSK